MALLVGLQIYIEIYRKIFKWLFSKIPAQFEKTTQALSLGDHLANLFNLFQFIA